MSVLSGASGGAVFYVNSLNLGCLVDVWSCVDGATRGDLVQSSLNLKVLQCFMLFAHAVTVPGGAGTADNGCKRKILGNRAT